MVFEDVFGSLKVDQPGGFVCLPDGAGQLEEKSYFLRPWRLWMAMDGYGWLWMAMDGYDNLG